MPRTTKTAKKAPTKTAKVASRSLRAELDLKPAVVPRPRRLRLPPYRPFRLKRVTYPEKLPSVWKLTATASEILWRRRWLFLGIGVIYALLNILFVQGLSGGTNVAALKQQLSQGLGGSAGQLLTGLSVFTALLTAPGNNSNGTAGAYQLFLGLLFSLATIWAVRQTFAGQTVRLRDTFYRSMYPLVPFILVLVVVLLQTVPFLAGGSLYATVLSSGIAATALENVLWALLFFVLTFMTVYMLCSSLFALYIVTLPDMTPLKALRSARQLVRYRRGAVFRKVLFIVVVLLFVAVAIMLPVIWFAAPAAPWVFFALSMSGLVVLHVYMYTLYKALLA